MDGDDGDAGPEDAAPGDVPRAETSYVSTPDIIEREADALARDRRQQPGFWHPFLRARLVRLTGYVVVVLLVTLTTPAPPGVAVLAAVLVFGAWTAVAARSWTAAPHRAELTRLREACPPGTRVRATYTAQAFEFTLPDRTVTVDPRTVTAARRRDGIVLLHEHGSLGPVCVPDELVGPDGLRVLRTVLGERLAEG